MSLPPELRVLCWQLSNTQPVDLPRLSPVLLRHVLLCKIPLSSPLANSGKADSSPASVLVHKLKTHLTSLLNGKSFEGRFAAVVLIKAVVEVGGFEILRSCEAWVRGLLSILGKPDGTATKEMCIVALTKIYCMTHPYQTLLREITTPTLPAFVSSCLNIMLAKSSLRTSDIPASLKETIFWSFTTLIPRHTTIYRPFVSDIKAATKPYLAPVGSEGLVPASLKSAARSLAIAVHQTVAKNAGGEEWARATRDLVKDIQGTADQVFRAVVEDWESSSGYVSDSLDVNNEPHGGGKTAADLPAWSGIDAGAERMIGLINTLEAYIKSETSTPVALHLEGVLDLFIRLLSIGIPPETTSSHQTVRFHPAIGRDEKDALSAHLPQIYAAALSLIHALAERLQDAFAVIAPKVLEQLAWVFFLGKHDPMFRLWAYRALSKVLTHVSCTRALVSKLSVIIEASCRDLRASHPSFDKDSPTLITNFNGKRPHQPDINGLGLLDESKAAVIDREAEDTDLTRAAIKLLPLWVSQLPQEYLSPSLRSKVEGTAVLIQEKNTMLACILYPYIGQKDTYGASILPHLAQACDSDLTELLLRPRMPLVPHPEPSSRGIEGDPDWPQDTDTPMDIEQDSVDQHLDTHSKTAAVGTADQHIEAQTNTADAATADQLDEAQLSTTAAGGRSIPSVKTYNGVIANQVDDLNAFRYSDTHGLTTYPTAASEVPVRDELFQSGNVDGLGLGDSTGLSSQGPTSGLVPAQDHEDGDVDGQDDGSSDESVHLVMEMDTDSEEEDEIAAHT